VIAKKHHLGALSKAVKKANLRPTTQKVPLEKPQSFWVC
jgi:hypothetical protein